MAALTEPVRISVVGGTGYTGAELLRLLSGHPSVQVVGVVARSTAGKPIAEVLPSLVGVMDGEVSAYDAASVAERSDAAFCALPHGQSAPIVRELRAAGVRVFDLSGDFRLRDVTEHSRWYGDDVAPELREQAVYGLVELHREELAGAELVAVPGCYPTASVLALAPLLKEHLVEREGLIIDAKSGASGAGRGPGPATHLPEVAEGIRAYKTAGRHRHIPEIEQELSSVAGEAVQVTFTPHLVPMTRGILATAYGRASSAAVTAQRCTEAARTLYEGSPSVVVLEPGSNPDTQWIRGSNRAHLSYGLDERTGQVIAQATVDNLVKGAAGQAIQCLNVSYGLPEASGLTAAPIWP